jgi:hypothetical protein
MPNNEPLAVCEEFRPLHRHTLRGFCRIRFASGLILDEIAIHVGGADGRTWCSPPARPMVGPDGVVMRDARTGKIKYCGLIAFSTAEVRDKWSRLVLDAVMRKCPTALGEPEPTLSYEESNS